MDLVLASNTLKSDIPNYAKLSNTLLVEGKASYHLCSGHINLKTLKLLLMITKNISSLVGSATVTSVQIRFDVQAEILPI